MLALTCTSCHKKLSVKEEHAGKKVKCPGCGQVLPVPDKVATPVPAGNAELPTLAPAGENRAKDGNDPPTLPPLSQSDATHAPGFEASPDRNLTAFLAPPQADDELGRLGGFRILKILGHGGMGVVFQGEDPKLRRKVAIKAMLPHLATSKSSQERFLREARAAAALEHDHIVPIFHVGEDRGAPFIVMPFLKGESLDDRLKRETRLPLVEVLRIGREIAEGLAAAHEAGLIHRDIKPGNVWLEASPGRPSGEARVKILDFGLARANSGGQHLTQSGAIVGTPAYMAPEQGRGETVDARCDLWSLGVVLYRMCTGQLPFQGGDTVSTLMAVAMHEPPPPAQLNAEVPVGLSNLVMKLLAKDLAQRFTSAQEVVDGLRALEQGLQANQVIAAPRTKPVPAAAKAAAVTQAATLSAAKLDRRPAPSSKASSMPARRNRKPLLLALGGGLMAALVAGTMMFWTGTEDPKDKAPPELVANTNKDPKSKAPPEAPMPPKYTTLQGIKFAWIPPGEFQMGSDGPDIIEKPVHKVTLTRGFYMGVYEVTQAQWRVVMNSDSSSYFKGDDRPVDMVSWDDCQRFCSKLRDLTGKPVCLPTEAEWEYACRAGTTTDYCSGNGKAALQKVGWYFGNMSGGTHPGGEKDPNAWGLYDMHGNVWEWCQDRYGPYASNDLKDPQGDNHGDTRILRGGSVTSSNTTACHAALRLRYEPTRRQISCGIRVCFGLD